MAEFLSELWSFMKERKSFGFCPLSFVWFCWGVWWFLLRVLL